jgi:SAM-dependent methyltransferase
LHLVAQGLNVHPTSLVSFADPFFLAHRALRAEIARMAAYAHGIVLDVGCGAAPYRPLFAHAIYFGAEVPTASAHGSAKHADLLFDGQRLPIADASVDAVLCSQVLEHVFEPDGFLREIHRVLRPGGRLLLTVPFVWDEHEQPYDYARYSSFALRHLASKHGFRVDEARRTLADASLFAQLWLAYLFKVCRRLPALLRKILLAASSIPVNLAGIVLGWALPASPDLYLDNAMIWTKVPDGDSAHGE